MIPISRNSQANVEYFDCKVSVYKVPESNRWHNSYPWRFVIKYNGHWHHFSGVPNCCETKASALKRAWWRCKWMSEGIYNQMYITPVTGKD